MIDWQCFWRKVLFGIPNNQEADYIVWAPMAEWLSFLLSEQRAEGLILGRFETLEFGQIYKVGKQAEQTGKSGKKFEWKIQCNIFQQKIQ